MTTTDSFEIWTLLPAGRDALYDAWLDAGRHAAFTHSPASSSPWIGGELNALDGHVRSRFLELEPGHRIVQAWRTTDFPSDAPDSIVELRFEPEGDWTRLRVLHREVPAGLGDRCETLWRERYFRPLSLFVQTLPQEPAVPEAPAFMPLLSTPEKAPVAERARPRKAPAKRAAVARRATKKAKAVAKPAKKARTAARPAKKATAKKSTKKVTARKATKKTASRRAPRATSSARTGRAKSTTKSTTARAGTTKKATRRAPKRSR